jgi:hypothetical protein
MMTPDDFTAEWFSTALDTTVTDAEIEHIIWGTATKVLMKLSYAEATDLPGSVCVKGGFDEKLQGFGVETAYAIETNFFADVAPTLAAPLPRCLYARDGIVILEDLAAAGATFGDPLEPWSADRVAAALEVQAAWHRETWALATGPVASLSVGAGAVRSAAGVLLGPDHWSATFAGGAAPRIPAEIDDRERVLDGFHRLWERDGAGPLALAHGDAHIGNTYIDVGGRPGFLDWQGVCRAPVFYDVAYFIGGSLEPEDRRASERELVSHYLKALGAGDGPVVDADEAWRDYRRYTLHGFLWVVTPPVMQPAEKVKAMGERHAAAIADHDSLGLLGA